MKRKTTKTEVLRFRCDGWMKAEIARIAHLQGLDEADIMRMAAKKVIAQFNQPLNAMSIV